MHLLRSSDRLSGSVLQASGCLLFLVHFQTEYFSLCSNPLLTRPSDKVLHRLGTTFVSFPKPAARPLFCCELPVSAFRLSTTTIGTDILVYLQGQSCFNCLKQLFLLLSQTPQVS